MEGGVPTGTGRGEAQRMLARLWAVLDPAVDALPTAEVLEHVLARLRSERGSADAETTLGPGDALALLVARVIP